MAHTIYDLDHGLDVEIPCRACGRHQGECDDVGMCCRHCTHHLASEAA